MRPPLGQHFLRDARVLDDILEAAALGPGERVLEIGPGKGVLTDRLAKAVGPTGRVVAVEYDPALFAGLQDRWDNVETWLADAAAVDLGARGPYDAIVANLPYQISGPITIAFLDLLRPDGVAPTSGGNVPPADRSWTRAVLMVQKEFADRLVAGPGGDNGRLTIQVARWCEARMVRKVPPGAFDPPPKVDSAVVRLVPRAEPVPVADEALWDQVLRAAFGQRRKKLPNALRGLPGDVRGVLADLGLSDARAEELDVQDFARLVRALAEARA